MMKRPLLHSSCLIFLSFIYAAFLAAAGVPAPKWIKDFAYQPAELHPITLSSLGIPEIIIQINRSPLKVLFDTGNSGPLSLTTAMENAIQFRTLRQEEELNADGSHRGWSKVIELGEVEILGAVYKNHSASLIDWKMTSDASYNGLVGLKYFLNMRITLDYKNRLIAVSESPAPADIVSNPDYAVVPLLKAPKAQGEIVYVAGEVNGHKQVIYLDTGTTPSCVSPEAAAASESYKTRYHDFYKSDKKYKSIDVKIGQLTFQVKDIFESNEIRRGTDFPYPVGLILGSDQLKNLVLTVDKIDNRLILRNAN